MSRDPLQVWREVAGRCGALLPNERLLLSLGGSPAFRVRPYELKSCRGSSLRKLMSWKVSARFLEALHQCGSLPI